MAKRTVQLTSEQYAEYPIDTCPVCKSNDVRTEPSEDLNIWARCGDCESDWTIELKSIGYSSLTVTSLPKIERFYVEALISDLNREYEEKLETLVRREIDDSGFGRHGRDIGWYFKTEMGARNAAKKLKAERSVRRVKIWAYGKDDELIWEEDIKGS